MTSTPTLSAMADEIERLIKAVAGHSFTTEPGDPVGEYFSTLAALAPQIVTALRDADRCRVDLDQARRERDELFAACADAVKATNEQVDAKIGAATRALTAEAENKRLREAAERHEEKMCQAYQVVGALAHETDTFDTPAVQRALDYLSSDSFEENFLPWSLRALASAQHGGGG